MPQTRIYLPLTADELDVLARDGAHGGAVVPAHAVTAPLERSMSSADEEEREYVAMCEAAQTAATIRTSPAHRRVIAAADVPPTSVRAPRSPQPDQPSRVEVTGSVPLRSIVSFHVDETPGGADDDLLWYDVTELGDVVAFVRC